MGKSLTRKIIESHFVSGDMTPGKEIFIKVDQTLTHDINAVMTYLAFEAIGLDRVRTECSVSYLDHNLLYVDNKTPDDHIYLQSAAKKFGVYVSRPGNGICHTVHVSRFGVPGKVSMGGDSHTPHGGAIGMLCIGVGGMDVATAMTGVPMRLTMPRVVRVNLTGKLRPGCNSKEVILEMLRRVTIKGGLGNVYEYVGPAVAEMEIPARATIANMGAEMGATTSIFPADAQVKRFLAAQGRPEAYTELLPDEDAEMIKQAQRTAMMRDPSMAAATLTGAQADAMKAAASNSAGAMTGFMGMGMSMQAGSGVMGAASAANLRQMEMNRQHEQTAGTANMAAVAWTCSCGTENTGKFCAECGKPMPTAWTCSCGTENTGKFCTECGKPAPAAPWTCSCGAVNTGKFCAECGKPKA